MTRKLISLVLALCMIMSCFAISGISASAAVSDEATAAAGEITVYFTDNNNWGTVNVYAWGGSATGDWPGKAMTKYQDDNGYGQKVYSATIAADATGVIFNNGNGQQTVDIETGIVDGAQWYLTGEQENGKLKVGYIAPETPAPETTAAPANDTTAPSDIYESGEDSIVYFKPGSDWESDDAEFAICVYGWNHWAYEWVSMTYVGNGIYKSAIIPSHAVWASCTFGRFEKNTGRYTDQTAWNISAEVGYMAGKLYTLDANQWSGATGTWSDYVPVDTTTAPEPEETTEPDVPGETMIIYFTDTQNWGSNIYAHYWGNGETQWPGVLMQPSQNRYGSVGSENVYYTAVPKGITGLIFSDGNGRQTVDITTDLVEWNQWYATGEMEGNKYKVTTMAENPINDGTTAPIVVDPTTIPETTEPFMYSTSPDNPDGTITVYFTNAQYWDDVKVYYWGTNNDPEWPGVAMTYKEGNDFGQDVYQATIPATATAIIFNGSGVQTVDITTGIEDGAWWYTIDEMEGNNYKVGRVAYEPEDTTVATEPEETTVAPEPEETTVVPEPEETTVEPTPEDTITVYFTDALNWGEANVYYWGTDTDPEWPGTAMTVYQDDNGYGQKVYQATVPAAITGVIFNGNGKQTVDITTGIADGAQWYTNGEMEGANYKVGYVEPVVEPTTEEPTEEPTTVEPTTVAPTTVAPTTVEPTTVAPTTVEPTTEEPTDAPDPEDTTIKLVVPNNINSAYAWSDARLYYNNTGKSADNRYIDMTAANETYYMTELGTGISAVANAGAWKVFTVTVTPEQATAIDGALWVGFANSNNRNKTVSEKAKNILKAGVGEFDAAYSNAKASISDFDGYTFIIKDNNSTTSPYSSFIGYWTSDFTTVMMAAPMSDNSYSNWNAVSLSYGESGDSEIAIPMFNTGNTTKVADIGDMSTLRTGRWYIYAVTLDAAQTADVNAAARVGFVKPGGNNRTAGSKNVLKAKTNVFDGNYNSTARTLEELEGQVFVVKAKANASSIVIYNGEWQTEDVYTAGNADTVHIYFAAPKGADKTTAGWDTGVQLYYGTTTAYQNCDKVDMTKLNSTRDVTIEGTGLTTLKSGAWDIYTIELDAEMISTIDASTTVGFIKTGSYNRTSALYTKNIAKAPTTEDGTYTKNKQSIETFDGKTFIINTCADTKNERTSYMGIWCN